jgi:superoxide dismutase
MWSHSFYKDYLSDKKSYLLAQMKELNWKVIEERFLKIEKLVESMR